MLNRRSLLVALGGTLVAGRAMALPEPARVPVELVEEALELEAAVPAGNPRGDVTIIEFFDYNCPWCKRSAQDLPALLRAEPDLNYVLVNFAVLGRPSVEATKVALGFFRLYGPARYRELHERLFALRGVVDAARAVTEAVDLGAERAALVAAADARTTVAQMTEALRVGNSLGLAATPSFVIGPQAYSGHVSLDEKRALVAEVRS